MKTLNDRTATAVTPRIKAPEMSETLASPMAAKKNRTANGKPHTDRKPDHNFQSMEPRWLRGLVSGDTTVDVVEPLLEVIRTRWILPQAPTHCGVGLGIVPSGVPFQPAECSRPKINP